MSARRREFTTQFGLLLRNRRTIYKWNQRKVAKMAGITQAYLSKIENGEYVPDLVISLALLQSLGLKLDAVGDLRRKYL